MQEEAVDLETLPPIAFDQHLVCGLHRLVTVSDMSAQWRAMLHEVAREYFRRRRMVRVTTLKYRARKRRR
jgi:hypothetical protein